MKTKSEEQAMKKCSKCDVVKPLDEFRPRKDNKDGRRNNCKECAMTNTIEQYRQDNKEVLNEYNRQYYQDNKEEINEYNRQYYQDNIRRIK